MFHIAIDGPGGAGKSTVSAGLACALARRDRRVLLVDGDAGLRSLDVMLGIAGQAVYDLADVIAGDCAPASAVYPSPICPNVFVMPAPVSLERLAAPQDMVSLCQQLKEFYDDIIFF